MGLLKFQVERLIGCIIWFLGQGVPLLCIFYGSYYIKNDKYMKNVIAITFFHSFLIFLVEKSIESMQHGYSLDEESNFSSNEFSCLKIE